MKLSTLIAYRNLLDSYIPSDIHMHVGQKLDPVMHVIQHHEVKFPADLQDLVDQRKAIDENLEGFYNKLQLLRKNLQDIINTIEPRYLLESYQLYEEMYKSDEPDYILGRRLDFDADTISYLRGRIREHSDWHRAGLIIRPGREDWVEDLVGLDPLYLVDHCQELLGPAQLKFNTEYRKRLRLYQIHEDRDKPILNQLPDNQFGFCLVYNFFNYKPFEIVRTYLKEIFEKLSPGGVLAFTINDCDQAGAVELCERHFMCYIPGSMLIAVAKSMGYIVRHSYNLTAAATWFELEKPGKFKSLRGGQTLARVLNK